MSTLFIIKASAGSGKTYRLSLQYLSYLFNDSGSFRHILAVTFTNKATDEMKTRIIDILHSLATGKSSDYIGDLQVITGLDEKNIRLKAGIILTKILHHYSWFYIDTIDSFFLQIIRSFTREMGIQSGYSVELDESMVLNKSVDALFVKMEQDAVLRDWIVNFANERIEESKSWNLKHEIISLGSELFKEGYKQFSRALSEKLKDKAFLNSYKAEMFRIIRGFENRLAGLSSGAVEVMRQHHIEVGDIYQKSRGPAGYFTKLADGIISVPNSYVSDVLADSTKWTKSDSEKSSQIAEICRKALHPILEQIVSYYSENAIHYNTAKTILGNFNTLGILTDLALAVNEFTKERNLFLISDSAYFINTVIDNNDTPFIYEKAGNYFHHFLIDEFQDTSDFQWWNFKPLISNSLSQGHNCLVVGDVKQSIYRWRNSNWEVLAKGIFTDFYHEAIREEILSGNYRSAGNIVQFNNTLFNLLPGILGRQATRNQGIDEIDGNNHTGIPELYNDVVQQTKYSGDHPGYVKIAFVREENYSKEYVFSELVQTLKQLQDKGYSLKDIAILTRGRKEGKEIADFLLGIKKNDTGSNGYRFDIVSDESLLLSSSSAVNFIIASLRYLVEPGNSINRYFLEYEYFNYLQIRENSSGSAIMPSPGHANGSGGDDPVSSEILTKLVKLRGETLAGAVRSIISMFDLGSLGNEIVFIHAFKDMVLNYVNRYSPNIPLFLEYWEDSGITKSVAGADNQDAIRILTIHKAKGLEFEAVIMPFCDWKIEHQGTILWCKPTDIPFNRLEIVPVAYRSDLRDTVFSDNYHKEKIRNYIDNLNLLYVAFTRAKKALICFSGLSNKLPENISTVSHLLYTAIRGDAGFNSEKELTLNLQEYFSENDQIFEFGTNTAIAKKTDAGNEIIHIDSVSENDATGRIKIAFQGKDFLESDDERFHPVNYGKLLHELFSDIGTPGDLERALDTMQRSGKIDGRGSLILHEEVSSLLTDPQVSVWFSDGWKVLTERDILISGGGIRRPDRVLIKDNTALIIDLKFGNLELTEHHTQVAEYMKLMQEMGFEKTEAYLLYVSKRKVVPVIQN